MISEVKPAGAGFGQRRFLVRGRGSVAEARLVVLRPTINEYPELFPLDVSFPQAGRRAGSRAALAVGGEGGEGGAGSAPVEKAPVLNYPVARPREGAGSDFNTGGGLPVADSAPGCGLVRGAMWRSSPQVGAGATTIEVSGEIALPFRIVHVSYWSENVLPTGANMSLNLFISDDASVNNTPAELGQEVPFFHPAGGATPFTQTQHHYPNWLVSEPGKRLKARWVNASGGALETYLIVDFEYLN